MCKHDLGFFFSTEIPKDAHPDLPGVFYCGMCNYWLPFNPTTAGQWKKVGSEPHMDQWRTNTLTYKPQAEWEKKIKLAEGGIH